MIMVDGCYDWLGNGVERSLVIHGWQWHPAVKPSEQGAFGPRKRNDFVLLTDGWLDVQAAGSATAGWHIKGSLFEATCLGFVPRWVYPWKSVRSD